MTNRTRCVLVTLLACASWLGCHPGGSGNTDAGTSAPDSGQTLPEDAGLDAGGQDSDAGPEADAGEPEAWDGSYTALEETGDYADPGRYAPCTFNTTDDAGTPLACGSWESFDLSACNRDTLSRIPSEGIFSTLTRTDSTKFLTLGSGGILLPRDGGTGAVNNTPMVKQLVDGSTFFVSGLRTLSDGGTYLYSYAGCEADSAQHFRGCYQFCTNGGARRFKGTFDAVRTQRLDEPESSGISLISESPVSLGIPVDVYVAKNRAYVVGITRAATQTGGLTVFDVSDRAHPKLVKTVTLDGDTYWNSVWAKGDALYVGSGLHGVLVFDISNPDDPVMLRGVPGDRVDVHTMYIDGNRLYAQATGANQVLLFDVSEPLNPVLLNRYSAPADPIGMGYPHDAFAYQNRLYINQMFQGYYVVDVADAANVKLLGSYTYNADMLNPTHANAVGTFAGRTIAFEGGEAASAHLRVLDVTDPAHIVKIGEVRMRPHSSIHNMILRGKKLYVAWYVEGLRIFDVSIPTEPKQVAYYNTFRDSDPGRTAGLFESAIGIRVPGDGYVYVVDMTRGLLIFQEQ